MFHLENEETSFDSSNTKAFETTNKYVLNPVEVDEAQPTLLYEPVNTNVAATSGKKEKKGFWSSLFGEKKCKVCSQKKNQCHCKNKVKKSSNKNIKNNFNETDMCKENMLSMTSYGVTKDIQNYASYPAKCTFPLAKKGCGCHLYFCIDSKHPRAQIKNRKSKESKTHPNYLMTSLKSNEFHKENKLPKVTLLCQESTLLPSRAITPHNSNIVKNSYTSPISIKKEHMRQKEHWDYEEPSHDYDKPTSPTRNILQVSHAQVTLQKGLNQDEKEPSHYEERNHTTPSTGNILKNNSTNKIVNKAYLEQKSDKEWNYGSKDSTAAHPFSYDPKIEHLGLYQMQLNNEVNVNNNQLKNVDAEEENNDNFYKGIKENYEYTNLKNKFSPREKASKQKSVHYLGETNQNDIEKNKNSDKLPSDHTFQTDNVVYTAAVKDSVYSTKKLVNEEPTRSRRISFLARHEAVKPDDQNKIMKDYEAYRRSTVKRRTTTGRSGAFVRSSLISIRQGRKYSQLEEGISLILSKLNVIEGKIKELEKYSSSKERDIQMGISCNHAKSTMSVTFNKNYKGKSNEKSFVIISPSVEGLNKTVKIKSQNENIYVTSPRGIDIKKHQKKNGDSRAKEIVYHNSFELDAHTLGLKSLSTANNIKCKNPKILIEYPENNQTDKTHFVCDKWRRVSEELKISQPHVPAKSKCSCKKILR